jgi:hypothetical protein
MERERVVLVKCRLSRGGFPSECVFRVTEPGNGPLTGTAPLHYCYDANHNRLQAEIAANQEIEGAVAGVEIEPRKPGDVRVYLPDGEVYVVNPNLIITVGASDRVPVQP